MYSYNNLVLSAEAIVRGYDATLLDQDIDTAVQVGHVRAFSVLNKEYKLQLAAEDAVLELLAKELEHRHTRFGLVPYLD